MSRKRFVKLLMSRGYSRNDANTEAREAVSRGIPYDSRCLYILCEKCGLVPAGWLESIDDAVERLSQRISDMVRTIVEAIPTIIEAITATLPQVITEIERLRQEAENATE